MAVNWESIKKAAAFHMAAEKKTEEEKKAQRLLHGPELALEQAKRDQEQLYQDMRQMETEKIYRKQREEQERMQKFLGQHYQPVGQHMQAMSQLSNMYGAVGLGFPAPTGLVTTSGSAGSFSWVSSPAAGVYYPQGIIEQTCPVQKSAIEEFKLAESRQVFKQAKVPDSINMIIGWRTWRVKRDHEADEWRLQAIGQETVWEPKKKMAARCVLGGASVADPGGVSCHPAPQRNCSCGFWAFKAVDMLPEALIGQSHRNEAMVIGSVDLWGRVIETENGFRAEYAYPKELWLLEDWLEELGWIYGVPIRTRKIAEIGGSGDRRDRKCKFKNQKGENTHGKCKWQRQVV